MPSSDSSFAVGDRSSVQIGSSPASSPPPADDLDLDSANMSTDVVDEARLQKEEEKAHKANIASEKKRKAALARKKKPVTKAEREEKAKELDDLLNKSAAFSDILTKKTQVLGRVGSSLDGETLGEHNLQMAKQPDCLVGGTMRDYQLEGLTWLYEICSQAMSGILADEMGLGKTIQTISLIALLREQEGYLGPHLIIAPLSTLSNWMAEFRKWTPSIPVVMYHGTPTERKEIRETEIERYLQNGRPTKKFPVVCTSYEMVMKDRAHLSKINWEFIIIDEGHRMKNSDAQLFRDLQTFKSATRLLITGTPLQNNLKELWSLLHFLLPNIFTNWEAFETWFDFSDLQDEEGTEQFIEDQMKQDLVKKIHLILQPLLLRRVKADVAAYLPKKREYILYAPMTKEQTDLYNAITDRNTDTRAYLENKVVERLTGTTNTPAASRTGTPNSSKSLPLRTKTEVSASNVSSPAPKDAFKAMMEKTRQRGRPRKNAAEPVTAPSSTKAKRKQPPTSAVSQLKSAKSSRSSTPSTASRSRPRKGTRSYKVSESDDDLLSDDEFEAKIAEEYADDDTEDSAIHVSAEESERVATLEMAKKEIARKKLGNEMMQLRLVCNSTHNFYNPWSSGEEVDETIVTSSGKMLLLDRLLPALFERGHKVLIFSQFNTQLDVLWDYASELRQWHVCRIDGGVSQRDRQAQIDEFNNNPNCKLFILTTRAGGQGINLASADTVILFDSDWNPQQDLQAQDRCHRIGQTRPVVVYRLATKSTVEESLLMSADAKRRLEKLVIKKGGFKSMNQKMDLEEDLDKDTLRSLLLKDGEVYKFSGHKEILSDRDLNVLCDRSDAAYTRAAKGAGNADAYKVVETGAQGLTIATKK